MRVRTLLTSASSLVLFALATTATAQPAAPAESEAADEVVVTGTRTSGRTRLDSVSPVDVVTAEVLQRQGNGAELAQALANTTPAINFPRPSITDGSDHVRPATLRGLAPDQTLVLVNGVRGHVAALVAVNTSIGRGSTSFDLNTIPAAALSRVEVLRDGASAQYGADAIAGVINLRLREAREGGSATVNWGHYDTEVPTARGRRDEKDGKTWTISGWQGLPLGADGFLTVSAEYVKRDPTNRSDFANTAALPLYPAGTILGRFGDPELESRTIFLNAGLPIGGDWELYGTLGYQDRESTAAATARAYNNANNVPAIYPLGFLPFINSDITDTTVIFGARGVWAGFDVDLSGTWGENTLDYTVLNSVNATFGAASQRTFRAGNLAYDQWVFGADFTRAYEVGLAEPLNVAFGLEYRKETFQVGAGEPASYSSGGGAGAPVSQGFPGFRPSNVTDESRNNWSAYLDLEGKLTPQLTVGVAGRFEDYSDFGTTTTGKVSGRYDFTPDVAVRGAISTGFKAPALQQQFFSYTSTNNVTTVVNGVPVTNLIEAGTFRVTDPAAIALGSRPLEPETSLNKSLGVVFRRGAFELTVDAYQIEIEDRIVYSENLGVATPSTPPGATAAIQALLAPFGVSAARFFLNGVETETKGLDVVARYRLDTGAAGRFDFLAAANLNDTDVKRVPPLTPQQPQPLFDRANILTFEEGQPERKLIGSVDWTLGAFEATFRATDYDSVLVPNNNISLDYATGPATVLDLEARYTFPRDVRLAIGVNNLTDEYPDFTPAAINSPTGSVGFSSFSPYGFNGRFIYARATVSW
jgi:iron complex outermembrane receptor protein